MNKLKVADYCRASTNHEKQESSLEKQISYYGKLIAVRDGWQLVKNYAESVSGMQMKKRSEFMKMIMKQLLAERCLKSFRKKLDRSK